MGPDVERIYVSLRPTPGSLDLFDPEELVEGFVEVGVVQGSVSTLNLDASILDPMPYDMRFDAVRRFAGAPRAV